MVQKTYRTAVVLIPPDPCWEPIQALRRIYDRNVRRWMPHITLIYPFRPPQEFDAVAVELARACAVFEPLDVALTSFRHFDHGRGRSTLWLAPEPSDELVELQSGLQTVVPDCADISRYPEGFTPHLSVGQVPAHEVLSVRQALQASWRPIRFRVAEVSLIRRGQPPDDIFRLDRAIPLGGPRPDSLLQPRRGPT